MSTEWTLAVLAGATLGSAVTLFLQTRSLERMRNSITTLTEVTTMTNKILKLMIDGQTVLTRTVKESKGCVLEPLPEPDSAEEKK